MVLKGQFLERPTLIPVGDLVLEGVAHRGHLRPGVLVLPPPAMEGGGMDHVVGAEVAFAVSRLGHSTVRFNYRGVGGSQGQVTSDVDAWLADAREALQLTRENAGGDEPAVVVAIGASDAVAAQLATQAPVAGIALVNPSVMQPADLLAHPRLDWAVVLPELERADRAAWSAALGQLGGTLALIPGATRSYQRNLPLVGKAVADLVHRVARSLLHGPTR